MLKGYSEQIRSAEDRSRGDDSATDPALLQEYFDRLVFVNQNDNLDRLEGMLRLYNSLQISIEMQVRLKKKAQLEVEPPAFEINEDNKVFVYILKDSLNLLIELSSYL